MAFEKGVRSGPGKAPGWRPGVKEVPGESRVIPYRPRNWAKAFHASYKRFAVLVLHRRCGKSTAVINHHQRAALVDAWERGRLLFLKPGLARKEQDLEELIHPPGGRHYGHVMPTYKVAKLAVWDKVKHYARGVRGVVLNEQELLVRYPNGNKFQLFGADHPDSLRGPAFSGLSFDEYSQQDPEIFGSVLSKALGDHLGYAIFLGTIKGKDHLYRTWEAATKAPETWFSLWQDVDTSLATEEGITIQLLSQAMADDRDLIVQGLMSQDDYDQEWYLSADAAIKGAFFAKEMQVAKTEGRIRAVPYDPALPVDTDWDLGVDDSTTIWFSQSLRSGEIRLIDYYENSGEGLPHYVKVLQEKPYVYGTHNGPHDIKVRELGTGKSRIESARALGVNFEVTAKLDLGDGINATRAFLARCWFDAVQCARGIECLRNYRKVWNASLGQFTGTPVRNFATHGADALRGLATRHRPPEGETPTRRVQASPYDLGQQGQSWMGIFVLAALWVDRLAGWM